MFLWIVRRTSRYPSRLQDQFRGEINTERLITATVLFRRLPSFFLLFRGRPRSAFRARARKPGKDSNIRNLLYGQATRGQNEGNAPGDGLTPHSLKVPGPSSFSSSSPAAGRARQITCFRATF